MKKWLRLAMATTSMLSAASERVTADPPKRVCNCVAGVYAGWFANALGKLNPKPAREESEESSAAGSSSKKWVRWPRRGPRTRAP